MSNNGINFRKLEKSLELLEDYAVKISKFSSAELNDALNLSINLMKNEIIRDQSRLQKLKNLQRCEI